MYQYIVKRVLWMVPTLRGAAVFVLFLLRFIPGDICELRMAGEGAYVDEEALATCRAGIGIDKSIFLQFVDFMWGFVKFDLFVAHYLRPAVLVHSYRVCFHCSRRGFFRKDSISERDRKPKGPLVTP